MSHVFRGQSLSIYFSRDIMNSMPFSQELRARIAKYDLLCHPFYKAWSAGELSRDDLREYACQYYHHVAAFPRYLAQFAVRLDDGELRQAVLANMPMRRDCALAKRLMLSCGWILPKAWAPAVICAGISRWQRSGI